MVNQSNKLKVAALQCDIEWEQSSINVDLAVEAIKSCDAELLILPEMFATGFSMSPERVEQSEQGEIVSRIRAAAKECGRAVIFSAAISDNGSYYNRLFFISDSGEMQTYNKRHLFRMAGEQNHYVAGSERLVIEYKGFRICPLVCYDLRFPVFARNLDDYDLVVYIASWPEVRSYAWSTLLRARAIENQCYCIGVNRVGSDPKNEYSGDSVILDYLGRVVVEATPRRVELISATLSLEPLREFRESFPSHLDADIFEIKN